MQFMRSSYSGLLCPNCASFVISIKKAAERSGGQLFSWHAYLGVGQDNVFSEISYYFVTAVIDISEFVAACRANLRSSRK